MAEYIDPISPAKLAEMWDPFSTSLWGHPPMDRETILAFVAEGRVRSDAWTACHDTSWTREDHLRRIAWLVAHGWEDPIHLDVGVPCLGYEPAWPVIDGNHRFVAALVRGDASIPALCTGQVSLIESLCVDGYKVQPHPTEDEEAP